MSAGSFASLFVDIRSMSDPCKECDIATLYMLINAKYGTLLKATFSFDVDSIWHRIYYTFSISNEFVDVL